MSDENLFPSSIKWGRVLPMERLSRGHLEQDIPASKCQMVSLPYKDVLDTWQKGWFLRTDTFAHERNTEGMCTLKVTGHTLIMRCSLCIQCAMTAIAPQGGTLPVYPPVTQWTCCPVFSRVPCSAGVPTSDPSVLQKYYCHPVLGYQGLWAQNSFTVINSFHIYKRWNLDSRCLILMLIWMKWLTYIRVQWVPQGHASISWGLQTTMRKPQKPASHLWTRRLRKLDHV